MAVHASSEAFAGPRSGTAAPSSPAPRLRPCPAPPARTHNAFSHTPRGGGLAEPPPLARPRSRNAAPSRRRRRRDAAPPQLPLLPARRDARRVRVPRNRDAQHGSARRDGRRALRAVPHVAYRLLAEPGRVHDGLAHARRATASSFLPGAAAATRIFRADKSQRRRGCLVDSLRIDSSEPGHEPRGYSEERFVRTGTRAQVAGHRSLWSLLRSHEPNLFHYLTEAGYDQGGSQSGIASTPRWFVGRGGFVSRSHVLRGRSKSWPRRQCDQLASAPR